MSVEFTQSGNDIIVRDEEEEYPEDDLCPNCGGRIAIRNPTGHCDHLYYPDYMEKKPDEA